MSREFARPGCQQLEGALRQHEEQPAAAVGLQLLLPQLGTRPAALRSIPVTQCSHAAGARNRSPFAPFAASAVSNAESNSSSEEHPEDRQYQLQGAKLILSAGFALPIIMGILWPAILAPAIGLVLTQTWQIFGAVWAKLERCYCNKWHYLGNCVKSLWRATIASFMAWLGEKVSARFRTEMAKVMDENLEKLLSPEQLGQLREVLGEHFDADRAYDTDRPSSSKMRLLVEKMAEHFSPEQLDQLQQGLSELYGSDMA